MIIQFTRGPFVTQHTCLSVNGHVKMPTGGRQPLTLRAGGLPPESIIESTDSPWSAQGLRQPDRFLVGLANVGMVQRPVDRGGGQGLRYQLIQACRVQVRGSRQGTFA